MSNRDTRKKPTYGKTGSKSSDAGNKSTMYGSFSILNMTPEEITKRYDYAIREHERYLDKVANAESRHNAKSGNKSTAGPDRDTSGYTKSTSSRGDFTSSSNLKSDLISSVTGGITSGASKALAGGSGLGGALKGGLAGASQGLKAFKMGLDPATIAMSLLAEGAIAAGKALIKYSKDTWDFNNKMIQQNTVSYGLSQEFQSRGLTSVRDANRYMGVNIANDQSMRDAGEAILPTFKDKGADVASSFTESVVVGQTMGVSYNEQVMRMYREQYKQSGSLGDAQLERLENLAELSEVTNLSLDELVQLTAGEQRDINTFANTLIQSYVQSGEMTKEEAIKMAGNYQELTTTLQAFAMSEMGMDDSSANELALSMGEIMTANFANNPELLKKYAGVEGIVGVDLEQYQKDILKAVEGNDLKSFMGQSFGLVEYGQETSASLWGTGDMNNYLSMAGLTNDALTSAVMSGTPGYSREDMTSWLDSYDGKLNDGVNELADKTEDLHVKMIDNIMQGINQSEVGTWAKSQLSKVGHKISQGVNNVVNTVGDLAFGNMFGGGVKSITPGFGPLGLPSNFNSWVKPKEAAPSGGGIIGGARPYGVGGGYTSSATKSTAPGGVGPWTMSAGYEDPWYQATFGRRHKGVDYAAPAGTPIPSTTDGTVVAAGWNDHGFGNLAQVRDNTGKLHYYAHMNTSPHVRTGQKVSAGTILGGVGTTGMSTGNHLHYQVDADGKDINPSSWAPLLWGSSPGPAGQPGGATSGVLPDGTDYPGLAPEVSYVFRSSLANMVKREDNSAIYAGVGGEAMGRAFSSALPQIGQSGNAEGNGLLEAMIGILQGIQGNLSYNTKYNGTLG